MPKYERKILKMEKDSSKAKIFHVSVEDSNGDFFYSHAIGGNYADCFICAVNKEYAAYQCDEAKSSAENILIFIYSHLYNTTPKNRLKEICAQFGINYSTFEMIAQNATKKTLKELDIVKCI